MSHVSGIMKDEAVLKGKPTLVRRVSNLLKDGNYSGPPMLFRHASMQRIRHCCQNLNLLPYLLYSFDNSKSHPLARKMHVRLSRFLHDVLVSILLVCDTVWVHRSTLRGIQIDETTAEQATVEPQNELTKSPTRFGKFEKPKRKPKHPLYLTAAVYLVPLLLVFQVLTLCTLTIIGKYTPGFIFLVSALLLLGGIALKILLHEMKVDAAKCSRTKKVQ